MAQSNVNLNTDAQPETLDLTLRLSVAEGKRPIDGSSKRKRDESDEDISTGRSSEDWLEKLEAQVQRLEELIHRYHNDLARKIDLQFAYAAQNVYSNQSANNASLKKLHVLLQQLIVSLQPPPSPKTTPAPSTSKKPPKPST